MFMDVKTNVGGVTVYSNKKVLRIEDSRVFFVDGSWCDVASATIVTSGNASISLQGIWNEALPRYGMPKSDNDNADGKSEPTKTSVKPSPKPTGIWSGFGLFALIAGFAYYSNAFPALIAGLKLLLTGSIIEITRQHDFKTVLIESISIVPIELIFSITAAVLVSIILGKVKGKHAVSSMLLNLKEGQYFKVFFLAVLAEEIIARYIFLGLFPKLPIFQSQVALYSLLLLGNGFWAYCMHITNFQDQADRNILRVAPQFVGGLFLSYIFLRHGLLASVITHFVSNGVLFSFHKRQNTDRIDLFIAFYNGLCVAGAFLLMSKPLTDLDIWLSHSPTSFAIPGWQFWDYFFAYISISALASLLLDLLLFDRNGIGTQAADEEEKKVSPLLVYTLGYAMFMAIAYAGFWLTGLISDNIPFRVMFVAIPLCFFIKSTSANGIVRVFFATIPSAFILLCVTQVLGFWMSLVFMLVGSVVAIPSRALLKLDD